ncbi:acyl-CoA thioesterase [Paenibacillus sediminis]|uniref:Acyl-CoA hydrolase n=1 Tax=Paenibacillus sediminis TaxID=664909 RepID=A0ABS4H4X3_9BACL|nr:acyl-CoA thioesterase [Paenibacillus sediminis]MBP1937583.1 acyl-CoA hydrolase [Paenibacillus sediminis]
MEPVTCKTSLTIKTSHVFPNDVNNHGTLFGGALMRNIDDVASISAMRHCRKSVVTASTDSVDFLSPIEQTDSVCLESYVSYTGKTSMEIFVKIIAENLFTGERRIAATSFLTFVALDENGVPTPVPPVVPETAEEKMMYETAKGRADLRRLRREESKKFAQHLTTNKYWE